MCDGFELNVCENGYVMFVFIGEVGGSVFWNRFVVVVILSEKLK